MLETKPILNEAFHDEDEYRPEPQPEPEPPAWKDGSIRVGIHTSIAGDIAGALDLARGLGCNALQIFSASPRSWPRRAELGGATGAAFRTRRKAMGLGPLVIHGNYLINLASPDRVLRVRSVQAFHDEIIRALALGADFLVAHPGAAKGANREEALGRVADGIRQASRGLQLGALQILLENTAGQGSWLGCVFSELRKIINACPGFPLGVCVDTAHTLAAGYEIRTTEGLERTLDAIENTVGLDAVKVIHVNDSKAPLGSRVDRHEHIGKGQIGVEAFRRILNHPRLAGKAFILETPIDRPGDDRRNVQALWKLLGGHPAVEADGETGARRQNGFTARRRRKKPARANARRVLARRRSQKPSKISHRKRR